MPGDSSDVDAPARQASLKPKSPWVPAATVRDLHFSGLRPPAEFTLIAPNGLDHQSPVAMALQQISENHVSALLFRSAHLCR
jgi:hypothetical protein